MKKIIPILLLLFLVGAKKIPKPPISDMSPQMQNWLDSVYSNFNNVEILDSNPNGIRQGYYGDIVVYASSSVYYWGVCTSNPSGTDWSTVSP